MPLIVLLLVAGLVELTVLIFVGKAIGVLWTIGLLVAAAVLGSWLLRREGRRTLQEIREATRSRRPPTREFADGVLIAVGGMLIILPGFVSDITGLLCLLPPTRALLRRRVVRAAERTAERQSRLVEEQMRAYGQNQYTRGTTGAGADGDVIDGEVVSVSEDDEVLRDDQELPPRGRPPSDGGSR